MWCAALQLHTHTVYRIVFFVVHAKRIFQKNILLSVVLHRRKVRAQHGCLIQNHVPCTAVVVRCHELLINFQNIQSHVIEMHIRARASPTMPMPTQPHTITHRKWYCKRETISCVFCVSCRVQFSLVHLCCGWTFYSHHFSCRTIRSEQFANCSAAAMPESTFGLHTNWLSARAWRRFMPTTFAHMSHEHERHTKRRRLRIIIISW